MPMKVTKLESHTQLANDYVEWSRDTRHGFTAGQRFGQYVWNKYDWNRDSWPELFYERDSFIAYDMLTQYVEDFIHETHFTQS